jgi:hypothetical protein
MDPGLRPSRGDVADDGADRGLEEPRTTDEASWRGAKTLMTFPRENGWLQPVIGVRPELVSTKAANLWTLCRCTFRYCLPNASRPVSAAVPQPSDADDNPRVATSDC